MAKSKGIEMKLPGVDDLFSTQEQRDTAESVRDIFIGDITDFPDHPFKIKKDQDMLDLADSISEYGVLVPALVRPKVDGGYEMVAGHRRKTASIMAGKTYMPCIVRDLTDDEATIIMVDSNLQREKILPSEKAFAYKMKLDAMKRQGQRTDLTSATVLPKSKRMTAREILAKEVGESHEQIRKYIRLTELIEPILEMVDDNKIAMRPAVELSYLPKEKQDVLYDTMQRQDCTPSHAQAIKMRKFSDAGKLTPEVILSILAEEKGIQKEQFRIPRERISKYFTPGTSPQKIEDTIIKALELYRKKERDRTR